jgi:ribonucleoside-diphosphate reductase alpha chain
LPYRKNQMEILKGNEDVLYEGEVHSAANLFDALKEGYYGKF